MIKKILRRSLNKAGMHVIKNTTRLNGRTRFEVGENHYDLVIPSANYAPWQGDNAFLDIYNRIKQNTLVDIYRCYELWELAEKSYNLDTNAHFIEIGVWRGGTASVVGTKLASIGANVNFYLADTFSGVKKSSDKDSFYFDNEHADTSQALVLDQIKGIYSNYKILNGIFPEDTAHLVDENAKFSFCHIDVDVYNSSKDIVDWIWKKLIVGGVIIFDDYGFHTCDGITKYVNEQKRKTDRLVVHNLNGHALLIKIK